MITKFIPLMMFCAIFTPALASNGVIKTEKLAYQPPFLDGMDRTADNVQLSTWVTTYLVHGYLAGSVIELVKEEPPDPTKNVELAAMAKSMAEKNETRKTEHVELRKLMFDEISQIGDSLSGKSSPNTPQLTKAVPTEAKQTPESTFHYANFIECLKIAQTPVKAMIYAKQMNLSEDKARLEGVILPSLFDENGPNENGMVCAKFLGGAAFNTDGWHNRAQITELFLSLADAKNGEEKIKNLVRALISLRHPKSPVFNSPLWRYVWLRSSQALISNAENDAPSAEELLKDFVRDEKDPKYYQNPHVNIKVKWDEKQLQEHVELGEAYAAKVLP